MEPQSHLEWAALKDLVKSDGWKVLRNMLVKRRAELQEEVNTAVANNDLSAARDRLARMKESLLIIDLVNIKIKELSNQGE